MTAPELTTAGRDVEELLPFFAAGTLKGADKARVEAALAADAELRRRLAIIEDERGETILLNETLRGPSVHAFDKLMAKIDAEPARRPTVSLGLAERFADWLQGFGPRKLAFATAAAALVLMLQAGALIGLMANRQGGFETASHGGQVTATRVDLTVIFQDDARQADIAGLLARNGLIIVRGPLPGGIYQLQVDGARPTSSAFDQIVNRLRGETRIVRLAAPV